jgi:hypothetical protein
MTVPRVLAALAPLALAGCASVRGGVRGLWEITKESGGTLLWDTLLWTVGAGVLGLIGGIVAYRLLARAGAFRLEGAWGQVGRILTGILVPQLMALCLASAGFFEGLYRGSYRALTEGQATTGTYQTIGVVGSEAVGGLYFFDAEWRARGSFTAARIAFLERLAEFRDGAREIDAHDARGRLKALSQETLEQALDAIREETRQRFPALGSGRAGVAVDALFSWLGPALVEDGSEESSGWRLPFLPKNPFAGLPDRLPEVARRSGDPDRISYRELASFVVEQVLVRPSLGAVKLFCRSHAYLSLAPIPFLFLIPLAGFALARWLQGPRPSPAPAEPPRSSP